VGKHSIAREGHMFDINLVESASPDEVVIHFERDANREKFVIDIEGDRTGTEIVNHINTAFASYSLNFTERYLIEFAVEPPSRLKPLPALDENSTLAGGFIAVYKAFCNYYQMPVSEALIAYVENLVGRGVTTLDLDAFAHEYRLKPIVHALKHNVYFKRFVLSDVQRETAVSAIAVSLIKNATLEDIVVRNVDAKYEGFISMGKVLAGNIRLALRHIDFSHCKMEDKGAKAFASGLEKTKLPLLSLRLNDVGIGEVGALSIVKAVAGNECLKGMHVLELSDNPLRASSKTLAQYLSSRDDTQPLQLNIAGSEAALPVVLAAVPAGGLVQLECGGHALTSDDVNAIVSMLGSAKALRRLSVTNSELSPSQLLDIPKALAKSEVKALILDLSGNDNLHGSTTFKEFIQVCEAAGKALGGLRLLNTSLDATELTHLYAEMTGGAGARLTLVELAVTLHPLADKEVVPVTIKSPRALTSSPSRNLKHSQSSKTVKLTAGEAAPAPEGATTRVKELFGAVQQATCLRRLTLGGGVPLGSALMPLLKSLSDAPHLAELDIRQQAIGDAGAEAMGTALQDGAQLRVLYVDQNSFTAKGFAALGAGVARSSSIIDFPVPVAEYRALCDVKGADPDALQKIIIDIEDLANKNRIDVGSVPSDEEVLSSKKQADADDDDDDDDASSSHEAEQEKLKKKKSSKKSKKK